MKLHSLPNSQFNSDLASALILTLESFHKIKFSLGKMLI